MMNTQAMKNAENFAKTILNMPLAAQDRAWKALEAVMTAEELEVAKKYVGIFHLMTDRNFYETVREEIGEQIWSETHAAS